MAYLEATYQETNLEVSPEVEFFAGELDRFNSDLKGTPTEKRAQIFKMLDSYYSFTRKRADKLKERISRSRRGRSWQRGGSTDMDIDETDDRSVSTDAQELRSVEEEAQTWDLLRRILPLRYRDPTQFEPKARKSDQPLKSRKQHWDDFLLSESLARERKLVLEWLQNTASHGPPIDEVVSELQQSAERGDIVAHGWLHTRHKIKLWKSINAYQGVIDPDDVNLADAHLGSNTVITQLDPDAITRQGRKLEPQDVFFERAIWLGCFEMLRRGFSMAKIREWCSIRTELWRAVAIAPLPLSNSEDEDQPDFSPASLVLWRRMCFATATKGGTSDYDRAVYGILAGDIVSVEKVCKSWDDFLFLHYNALLRTQFDSYLIKQGGEEAAETAAEFPVFNAVQHHSEPSSVGRRLIATLEDDARTAREAATVAKALQGAIIANELDRLMYLEGVFLSHNANEKEPSKLIPRCDTSLPDNLKESKLFKLNDHDNLRIMAHILIITSALDRLSGATKTHLGPLQKRGQAQELMIIAYVSFLRLSGLVEMIPLYCSKISSPRQYLTLSRNMIQIDNDEGRMQQLGIMKRLGMDLLEFAKAQPEIYLEDVGEAELKCTAKGQFKILKGPMTLKYGLVIKTDFFGEDPDFVEEEDKAIIRSMEWLMLAPGLLVETCGYAIRIYKYFLSK
jgi:nuclear pore complex protein Nup107